MGYPVAIFHLSVKTISRSAGRSATAAIAYRSGEKITDERTGMVFDYSRRKGIEHTEIFLPAGSPQWATNRAELWNAAEQAETRKNSTVAREFEIAIPSELNKEQRLELVRDFARDLVERHGMAVDVAIHEPGKEGDNRNHHAHVLCTTRRLTPEGFKDKTRELDERASGEVLNWRARFADTANRHLENAGRGERVDHRSLEAQRTAAIERGDVVQAEILDRVPTIHLGPNVIQMEQRGIPTERGTQSRDITTRNAQIIDLAAARKRMEAARSIQEPVSRDLDAELLRDAVHAHEPLQAANDAARPFALVVNNTRGLNRNDRQESTMPDEDFKQPNAEQLYEDKEIAKQQASTLAKELNADNDKGDHTKEARRRELLARFKEKADRDRGDNDRGH